MYFKNRPRQYPTNRMIDLVYDHFAAEKGVSSGQLAWIKRRLDAMRPPPAWKLRQIRNAEKEGIFRKD